MSVSGSKRSECKEYIYLGEYEKVIRILRKIENIDTYYKLKEQKIFSQINHNDLLREITVLINRLFDGDKLIQEQKYLNFVRVYLLAYNEIKNEIKEICSFQQYNLKPFLEDADKFLEKYLKELNKGFRKKISGHIYEKMPIHDKSIFNEIVFNNLRGRNNDAIFAFARMINTMSHYSLKISNYDVHTLSNKDLYRLYQLVSNLNTYDYILDQLSYNEWYVSGNSTETEFQFKIFDLTFLKVENLV